MNIQEKAVTAVGDAADAALRERVGALRRGLEDGLIGVSGLIEGFVTRQEWPWVLKIGIGALALAVFLAYQWVVGRAAVRAGELGDLEEFETGARTIVSA